MRMADRQGAWKTYEDLVIKKTGENRFKKVAEYVAQDAVFDEAGWQPLIDAMFAKLNSRPMTLVHNDMRPENMFRHKKDNSKFAAIDWALLNRCAPGMEFFSRMSCNLNVDLYARLDELFDVYLEALHGANPDTKVYTKEMIREDLAITCRLLLVGSPTVFIPVLSDMDGPFWPVCMLWYPRLEACYEQLGVADVCRKIAKEAGLIPE